MIFFSEFGLIFFLSHSNVPGTNKKVLLCTARNTIDKSTYVRVEGSVVGVHKNTNMFFGKLTKSGIPGWFLNKIGYLFFRDGARLRTSAKRLQNAFWRLNPLRLVCAQHPKPFFRCSTPQNSANDGAQKVLSTNNPILFRNTPGIPCPVLRFYKPPVFVHTAPDSVHTATCTEDLWPKIFHTMASCRQ